MNRKRSALVGMVLGALLLAPQVTDLASGAVSAFAGNSQTQGISTATYLAAAVSATGTTNPKQSLQIATGGNTNPQYFYVKNFGTDALIGFGFTGTATSGTLTYKRCPVGTSFSTATRCSDSSTPAAATAGAVTAALSIGAYLPMSATPSKTNITITIAISVNNTQDRAPLTLIS